MSAGAERATSTRDRDPRESKRGAGASSAAIVLVIALLASACASRGKPSGPGYRQIGPAVAFAMLRDSAELFLLDLREAAEFSGPLGHIPRARNVPLSDLDRKMREIRQFRGLTFLVYCRGDDTCGDSGMRRLQEAGFDNAILLAGGIEAWIAAGYSVRSAEPPRLDDTTVGQIEATHVRRLADGLLLEVGESSMLNGLFVEGITRNGRFVPLTTVQGMGAFCRSGERGAEPGWRELATGAFRSEASGDEPSRPYVRGCRGSDGIFRPESRDIQF